MKKLARSIFYLTAYISVYGSLILAIAWIILYPFYHSESTVYYYDHQLKTFISEKKLLKTTFKENQSLTIKKTINALLLEPDNLLLRRNQKSYLKCLDVHQFNDLLAINFSEELSLLTKTEESRLIQGLVLTLKQNYPSIKQIQIFLLGKKIAFLQGAYFYQQSISLNAIDPKQ